MTAHLLFYSLIRFVTFPLRYLPYSTIHTLGRSLGSLSYYLISKFRKKALSNLSLAKALNPSPKQTKQLAKASMQHLMITSLEYAKLDADKMPYRMIRADNFEQAEAIYKEGKGLILFCGHLANWELLYLDATKRMGGIAIGRPIKNPYLYRWVVSIREKCGGKIIPPQNAIKEGLRALKKGLFVGIVGDQGMPDSGFKSPFLGRTAWSSPLPALLSYRTGRPIVVLTMERQKSDYTLHYSDPIWPSTQNKSEEEVPRLMHQTLGELEKAILKTPSQWLWAHNRWKQQLPGQLKRRFRHDSLLVIFPKDLSKVTKLLALLPLFRTLYPTEYLYIKAPYASFDQLTPFKIIMEGYFDIKELFTEDFRPKLVFNFSGEKALSKHYKKQAALEVIDLEDFCDSRKNIEESLLYFLTPSSSHAS